MIMTVLRVMAGWNYSFCCRIWHNSTSPWSNSINRIYDDITSTMYRHTDIDVAFTMLSSSESRHTVLASQSQLGKCIYIYYITAFHKIKSPSGLSATADPDPCLSQHVCWFYLRQAAVKQQPQRKITHLWCSPHWWSQYCLKNRTPCLSFLGYLQLWRKVCVT